MPEVSPSRYLVQAGWDDAPHLDDKTKRELLEATPDWLRDARSKGEPSLGAGAIYPIPLADITVKPFPIGAFWKKAYGLDVGWNRTAAIWGAQDPADGVIYLYAEHYVGRALPLIHATSIKARGEWITGAADSSASSQIDGENLIDQYKATPCGLKLVQADKRDIAAALEEIWQMLALGRLKIFSTLQYLPMEYKQYRRDEHGKIVKEHDHLMDAMRYLIRTWAKVAALPPTGPVTRGHSVADKLAGI